MDIKELLNTRPEQLAEKQFVALKGYSIGMLKSVVKLLETEQFDEARKYLAESPAGDGYGLDNSYIDFNFIGNGGDDISEVIDKLEQLKSLMKKT